MKKNICGTSAIVFVLRGKFVLVIWPDVLGKRARHIIVWQTQSGPCVGPTHHLSHPRPLSEGSTGAVARPRQHIQPRLACHARRPYRILTSWSLQANGPSTSYDYGYMYCRKLRLKVRYMVYWMGNTYYFLPVLYVEHNSFHLITDIDLLPTIRRKLVSWWKTHLDLRKRHITCQHFWTFLIILIIHTMHLTASV